MNFIYSVVKTQKRKDTLRRVFSLLVQNPSPFQQTRTPADRSLTKYRTPDFSDVRYLYGTKYHVQRCAMCCFGVSGSSGNVACITRLKKRTTGFLQIHQVPLQNLRRSEILQSERILKRRNNRFQLQGTYKLRTRYVHAVPRCFCANKVEKPRDTRITFASLAGDCSASEDISAQESWPSTCRVKPLQSISELAEELFLYVHMRLRNDVYREKLADLTRRLCTGVCRRLHSAHVASYHNRYQTKPIFS